MLLLDVIRQKIVVKYKCKKSRVLTYRLESPLHFDNKGMNNLSKDLPFIHHMPHFVFPFNLGLLEALHRENHSIVLPPHYSLRN